MRGLEGVWRGASRHQSLIIYRPVSLFFTTHLLMSGGGVGMVRKKGIEYHRGSVGNKRRNQDQTRGEGHVKKKI